MTRPIYKSARGNQHSAPAPGQWSEANAGLYWDKFFDAWSGDWSQLGGGNAKRHWIEKFTGSQNQVGDAVVMNEHIERRAELVNALGGAFRSFRLQGPFVTGMGIMHPTGNGCAFHHLMGVPYLAGSGVKGMVGAYGRHIEGEPKTAERVCGDHAGAAGTVTFFDAMPTRSVELTMEVITPHTGKKWLVAREIRGLADAPGDWVDPDPIPFLATKAGTVFDFALAPRRPQAPPAAGAESDIDIAWRWLEEALDWLGAGAKTASAFGRFGEVT